jgi:hypothetical protein
MLLAAGSARSIQKAPVVFLKVSTIWLIGKFARIRIMRCVIVDETCALAYEPEIKE